MILLTLPEFQRATVPAATQPTLMRSRMIYIDNLRLAMIVLVVLIHLNVTYGQIGSWYYVEHRSLDALSSLIFSAFGSFTQAYFMGLLFFIAGYYVPGSYDRKGPWRFMKDRFVRLGVPTLVYMLLLNPLTSLIQAGYMGQMPDHNGQGYLGYILSLDVVAGSGPLWFALALLIFSLIYAGVRLGMSEKPPATSASHTLTHAAIVGGIGLLTVVTFAIRLVQPIGTSFYNMQLCFFPQYVMLFILGLFAYRVKFLDWLPRHLCMVWGKIAVFVGGVLWVAILLLGDAIHNIDPFFGGWHWQALAYAFWEALFCFGFSLGLLAWFKERCDKQNRLTAFLSANAFGVYVFHAPILVGVTMAMRGLLLHPMLKMGIAAAVVFPVCFGFSAMVRRVPLLRKVFS